MADQGPSENRPSFTSFWKRSREAVTGHKSLTFLKSNPTSKDEEQDGEPSPSTTKEKAWHRRLQVRKAQKEHRQRKADYVKQLESDAGRMREMISATKTEVEALEATNAALKSHLEMARRHTSKSVPMPWSKSHAALSNIGEEPGENAQRTPYSDLPPTETQQVINFILEMEHVCWDHLDYAQLNLDVVRSTAPVEDGHSVMASRFTQHSALLPESRQDGSANDYVGAHTSNKDAADLATSSTSEGASSRLNLRSLFELACAFNPGDATLTPVQLWFELAGKYSTAVLMRPNALKTLAEQLSPVIECRHYGAVVDRSEFERISTQVLGTADITSANGQAR